MKIRILGKKLIRYLCVSLVRPRIAQVYGTEIVKALKAGGCEADLALPIPGLTPDVVGVHIGARDPQNLPSGAIELSKMLTEIGVKFSISPIKPDFFKGDSFVLVIGAK
jgi:hypothetical protein